MRTPLPPVTLFVALYLGALCLGVGALCWLAPHVLFASEGYRTVARGIIGTLGTLMLGLGASLVWAAVRAKAERVAALLLALVIALSGAPAVAFYNLGALEPLRMATGVNVFVFVGVVLFLALFPACIALFALENQIRNGLATALTQSTASKEPHP